jgi:hypothetical protein
MAIEAELYRDGDFVAISFYPDAPRSTVLDTFDDRNWPVDGMYDDEKLARGERELLGIEALYVGSLTDEWLDELDKLDLPRVDIPDYGFTDAKLSDVLRWARARYGRKPQYVTRS